MESGKLFSGTKWNFGLCTISPHYHTIISIILEIKIHFQMGAMTAIFLLDQYESNEIINLEQK